MDSGAHPVQNDTLVAVDIAKEVFEVAVSDRPGRVALRKRRLRDRFAVFFAQLPQATVVMEASTGTVFAPGP
jgi:transposase